jgi:uncharacterized OB-fold protein
VTWEGNLPPPRVTPENEHFWTGGARGELVFLHCPACDFYIHPPVPRCPLCHGREVAPRAVSGRATVHSFTVNHQAWFPDLPVPYVIAEVAIVEQPSLRLTTNVVGCPPEAVSIGMPVQVRFERRGRAWLPLFAPAA